MIQKETNHVENMDTIFPLVRDTSCNKHPHHICYGLT